MIASQVDQDGEQRALQIPGAAAQNHRGHVAPTLLTGVEEGDGFASKLLINWGIEWMASTILWGYGGLYIYICMYVCNVM